MKKLITIVSIFLLLGCNSDNKTKAISKALKKSEYTGNFKATIIDGENSKSYNVTIRCRWFEEDYFQFYSDKDDITDSNEDGLIISGFQNGKKLSLTIVDNGKSLSTANITEFEKAEALSVMKGNGVLFKEGRAQTQTVVVTFSVECK